MSVAGTIEVVTELNRLRAEDARERRFRVYAHLMGIFALVTTGVSIYAYHELVRQEILPVLVFSLFIGLAWFYSFSLSTRSSLSISLDMAYLMTALSVLPHPLPIAVACCGAALGCHLRVRDGRPRPGPFLPMLGLNTGGLVLAAVVGEWVADLMASEWQFHSLTWGTVLSTLALFATYSLTNVVVMVVAMLLKGEPVLSTLGHYLKFIPSLELFTIPLSLGLALLYAGFGVWGFVPMAGTVLLASGILKKLNQARTELGVAYEQLQTRSRELRILNTIGREISMSLDPEIVFAQVAKNIQRILDAPHLFLALAHRAPQDVYVEYISRDGTVLPRQDRELGHGFTTWVLETRRPLLVHDLLLDRDSIQCVPVILDAAVRSIMATPLTISGEAIGVLCVESPRPGAFTVDHLSVFTTIAQQAAVALENARNFTMATVDGLTRLYLRDFFFRKLEEEQVRSRRYGSTFTVLMLDIDHFKQINDKLGHVAGDRYLQRIGEVIRETMRAADVPCRYGGEEFCILLPETDLEGGQRIAERIRARIANLEVRIGEAVLRTTISIGIAAYPADFPGTLKGLIEKADQALYTAKQRGRDRVYTTAARPAAGRKVR